MFFHLQFFLAVLVHHHDHSFETFSVHCCVDFVLAPRDRHDHLEIASFPSFSRSEPHAVPVFHDDFSRGCFDAQTHAICEEVGVVKGVHLLSGEVRSVTAALKVVEEVQEEVQEIEDEWEDEEVEGNGGLKVEEIRSLCDDHEMTRASET